MKMTLRVLVSQLEEGVILIAGTYRGILGLHQSTLKVVAGTNKETPLILFNAEKKGKLRWHGCGYL